MDLLARYLQAVKFFLPQRQQDDIVRELSENLLAQFEDQAETLGRPLTEAEQAEILKRHGHPAIAAGRYLSRQQLIGPVFFPFYMFALKIGLGVALLVTVVLGVVLGVLEGDPVGRAVEGMLSFPGRAIMVFAWTTLGFAALDIAQSHLKMTHDWDPRGLPKVVRQEHRISRYGSLCEFFLILGYIIWLLLLPGRPHLLLGPAARVMEPAGIWAEVYPLIIALAIAGAALKAASYVRPYWTRRKALARIAINAATILTFAVLLRGDEWFVLKSGATWPGGASADAAIAALNGACRMGLLIAGIITIFELLRELYRLNARRRAPESVDSVA